MAKDKLTDYDSTASGNLDVGGISVAEGMLPSGVNNAIRELMSHQADAFGAGTPLYVDQTNNRLGINQASPAHPLHVGTDDLIVDASGNLLVGTTTGGGTIGTYNGFGALSGGTIFSSATSNRSIFARRSTDGSIIDFRKDGTTVGSIGTTASDLCLTSNNVGFRMDGSNNHIIPVNDSLVTRDAAIDLGYSGGRFKDLYLSGGVYLGGTGAANHLDDYEEGTWTPVILPSGGGSYGGTTGFGRYTKIGNTVHVWGYSKITNVTGGGPNVGGFTALPFVGINDAFPAGNRSGLGIVREDARTGILGQMFVNSNTNNGGVQLYTGAIMLSAQTNDTFLFNLTYKTTA